MHLKNDFCRSMTTYLVLLMVLAVSLTAANAFANDGVQGNGMYEMEVSSVQLQNVTAAAQPAGTLPVYRFFNTETGTHFYTISEDEKNYVLATWPQFHLDGPAFYAYPIGGGTPPPSTTPHAGTWYGTNFSFNVSSDGTSLTSTGSSLPSGRTFELNVPVSGCSYTSALIYSFDTFPISSGSFNISGGIITGTFATSTTASGSYSLYIPSNGCSGSGTWSTSY